MRIASLVPGATETMFAIGAGDMVVARTHECNHPAAAAAVPVVTSSLINTSLPSARVYEDFAAAPMDPHGPFLVDEAALRESAPDVVIVASTCPQCAGDVRATGACSMPAGARIVATKPTNLNGVFGSLVDVASVAGMTAAGRALAADLRSRLNWVASVVNGLARPRVAVIEWTVSIYAPGNWIPDIVAAGGGINVFGAPGAPSRRSSVAELAETRPEVVVLACSGCSIHETQSRFRELTKDATFLNATRFARTYAVDGSLLWHCGPRLIGGAELMAWILHRPDETLRPPVDRGARLIEAGWVDVAALPVVVEAPA